MQLDTVLFNSLAALVLLVIALLGAPLPTRGLSGRSAGGAPGWCPPASRAAGPACLVTSSCPPAWPALPERALRPVLISVPAGYAELACDLVCLQSPHLPRPRAGAYLPVVLAHWGKLSGAPGGRSLAFVLGNMLSAGGERPGLQPRASLACRRGRAQHDACVQSQGAARARDSLRVTRAWVCWSVLARSGERHKCP
jgi:hypothetical protein